MWYQMQSDHLINLDKVSFIETSVIQSDDPKKSKFIIQFNAGDYIAKDYFDSEEKRDIRLLELTRALAESKII